MGSIGDRTMSTNEWLLTSDFWQFLEPWHGRWYENEIFIASCTDNIYDLENERWLLGDMIDHVGIYGSRVAEGLSTFNVGLVESNVLPRTYHGYMKISNDECTIVTCKWNLQTWNRLLSLKKNLFTVSIQKVNEITKGCIDSFQVWDAGTPIWPCWQWKTTTLQNSFYQKSHIFYYMDHSGLGRATHSPIVGDQICWATQDLDFLELWSVTIILTVW